MHPLKNHKYAIFFSLLLISVVFLFPAVAYSAKFPLGARCRESHECGTNLGCRHAETGDFSVCKITVPGTTGCSSDIILNSPTTAENFCADGMICRKDRCIPTYGAEDISNGKLRVLMPEPLPNPAIRLPSGVAIREYATLTTASKVFSFVLAIALLIGVTLLLKGWLTYRVSIGFIPGERKGMKFAALGATLALASVLAWALAR